MKSEWIQAGFYLITEAVPYPKDRQFLPPQIITVSTCMVHAYPGWWALPSENVLPEGGTRPWTLADAPEEMKLIGSEFGEARSWVDRSLASSDLGWPNVFLNLRAAREFKRRFMNAVPGVRLIGLVIAADDAEEFIPDYETSGLRMFVSMRLPPEDGGIFLGYDILGVEFAGGFHTFSCNDLARDYVEKLGITFNAHGLIPDQDQALAAAVPWCAVKLFEFDL
jgi:hypothetical protein